MYAGYAGISLEKGAHTTNRCFDEGISLPICFLCIHMIETPIKVTNGYIRVHRDWDSHCQRGHARRVRDHKEVAAGRPGGLRNWGVSPTP